MACIFTEHYIYIRGLNKVISIALFKKSSHLVLCHLCLYALSHIVTNALRFFNDLDRTLLWPEQNI